MARAPLPLGTWGKIRTYVAHVNDRGKPDRYRAVAQYRDFNGRTSQVEAAGRTKTEAGNNLRRRLKDRSAAAQRGELTAMHRFSVAADLWFDQFRAMVVDGRRSPSSRDTYDKNLRKHILPALGEVRLIEVTTPLVDKVLKAIRDEVGAPTAKTCRSVIANVMGLAVRYGAVSTNPVREVDRIESAGKRSPRSMADAEIASWLRRLQMDEWAVRKDLPDLTVFMLATGVRIGEALAVLWEQVDLESGRVAITHTIIRVIGEGLVRKVTKSSAGERALPLPVTAVAMLRRRFMAGARADQPVFPDSLGGFRDPSNVSRDIRSARGSGDLSWLTSHAWRKTAATILDDAGRSARQIADQLGHARPSLTQDVYMGRRVVDPSNATALDRVLQEAMEEDHG